MCTYYHGCGKHYPDPYTYHTSKNFFNIKKVPNQISNRKMYLATPLAFALAASLVTSATSFFPSADKATVSPEYTRPSIQEQLALVKNKPGLANIIASDQDDATGGLPYNFTLAATAQGRQRDPSLCRKKIHQEGILSATPSNSPSVKQNSSTITTRSHLALMV